MPGGRDKRAPGVSGDASMHGPPRAVVHPSSHPRRVQGADPPPGSPWDDAMGDAPALLRRPRDDGTQPRRGPRDRGAVERVRGGRTEAAVTSLVKPHEDAPPDAVGPRPPIGNVHVHGIDAEALAFAPSFNALCPELEAVLAGGIFVAHAAAWDVAFLEAEFARAGRPMAIEHYLDTLTLARRALPLPSHRLAALCEHFGIHRQRERAHNDVQALRAVFRASFGGASAEVPAGSLACARGPRP